MKPLRKFQEELIKRTNDDMDRLAYMAYSEEEQK